MAHDCPPRPCGYGNGGIQRHSRLRKNQLEVMREQDAPITADQRWHLVMVNAPKKVCAPTFAWCAVHRSMDLRQRLRADLWPEEDAATAEISRTSIWQWIHHQKR